MHSWIKRFPKLSAAIIILFSAFITCGGAILVLNNYSRISKTLWNWNKPEKYYMKSEYFQRCARTWESVWENDKLVSIISDEVPMDDLCTESDLDITEWSMEYIFDVIVEDCGKGTVFCAVDYDPHFYYPSKVTSLYKYTFEVKDFVVCDPDRPTCP